MERRSTNLDGYSHFQFDLTAHAGSSHGVRLSGGSTGGIVEAVGDDTNVSLMIRGQGTGAITLGSSAADVLVGGSTAPWEGFLRALDTAVSTPALFNDTDAGRVAETTHVITGISSQTAGVLPTYYVNVYPANLPTGIAYAGAYVGSTANDVHVRLVKGTTAAIAGTTTTFSFLFTRF